MELAVRSHCMSEVVEEAQHALSFLLVFEFRDEIRLRDNAYEFAEMVDDRYAAHPVGDHALGHLLHGGLRGHTDNWGAHQLTRAHHTPPSPPVPRRHVWNSVMPSGES